MKEYRSPAVDVISVDSMESILVSSIVRYTIEDFTVSDGEW